MKLYKTDVLYDLELLREALINAEAAMQENNWDDVDWYLIDVYNGSSYIREAIHETEEEDRVI